MYEVRDQNDKCNGIYINKLFLPYLCNMVNEEFSDYVTEEFVIPYLQE